MLPVKPRPRFLPTLTHVVSQADVLREVEPVSMEPSTGNVSPDHALVEQISASLLSQVMSEVRQRMQEIFEERMRNLEVTLQSEIESEVRQSLQSKLRSSDAVSANEPTLPSGADFLG